MELLKSIPGLEMVDMEGSKEKNICCGGGTLMTYPPVGQKLGHTFAEKIARTGADYIVNVCSGCDMSLLPGLSSYSFGFKDPATLINEAMGGRKYENKIEKYLKCESIEEVIEQSKEYIKENNYTEEEIRNILSMFFIPGKM
jgi:hypothetical protein